LVQRTSTLQGDTTLLSPPGVQLARGLTRSFQDISSQIVRSGWLLI
jgi:hypothetical protein